MFYVCELYNKDGNLTRYYHGICVGCETLKDAEKYIRENCSGVWGHSLLKQIEPDVWELGDWNIVKDYKLDWIPNDEENDD